MISLSLFAPPTLGTDGLFGTADKLVNVGWSFAVITHVLRPADWSAEHRLGTKDYQCELAERCSALRYSRKKVIPLGTVVTTGAEAAVLKSCVLNHTDTGHSGPAFR
jgi:hypothetical protein